MKKNLLLSLALFSGLCVAGLAHAEAPTATPAPAAATPAAAPSTQSPAQQAQSNRMKACAAQYHQQNIPKNQYKTFMSSCLKKNSTVGTTPAAAPATPPAPAPSGVTKASTSAP